MVNSTAKFRVIMNDYPEQVQLSNKRRAKYWTRIDKLPQYIMKAAPGRYVWKEKGVNKELMLFDNVNNEFVVKNSRSVGTPRFTTINSQDLWSGGGGSEWTRRAVEGFLQEWYIPSIRRSLPEKIWAPPGMYIQFEYIFYYPFNQDKLKYRGYQDYINHGFIRAKVFEDTLVRLGVIEDDNPLIVRGSYMRYVSIPEDQVRHMDVLIHFCKNDQAVYDVS